MEFMLNFNRRHCLYFTYHRCHCFYLVIIERNNKVKADLFTKCLEETLHWFPKQTPIRHHAVTSLQLDKVEVKKYEQAIH